MRDIRSIIELMSNQQAMIPATGEETDYIHMSIFLTENKFFVQL